MNASSNEPSPYAPTEHILSLQEEGPDEGLSPLWGRHPLTGVALFLVGLPGLFAGIVYHHEIMNSLKAVGASDFFAAVVLTLIMMGPHSLWTLRFAAVARLRGRQKPDVVPPAG